MNYSFRNAKAVRFPEMVHVDISTVCNYRCIHCPHGDPARWVDAAPHLMNQDHFYRVVDETSRHGGILRITTDGEPLLHPHAKEFLRYVLKSDLFAATLTTNGSIWDQELMDIVMQPSRVKFVVDVSLDAYRKETYGKIRRGGDFARVLGHLFTIIATRNRLKADHLYLMVNAIDQPAARGEMADFKNFWEQFADRVIIRKYVDVVGLVGTVSGPVAAPPPERWPCVLLWSRIMVNSHGALRFCIDDWNNRSVFPGRSIDDTSIEDMWRSPEYENLRQRHLEQDFSHELCAACTSNWVGLRWDYDYKVALDALFAHGQNWAH